MAEDLPERSQASFTNKPDLDELAPDPPRLITAADIPGRKSELDGLTTPNNHRLVDSGIEVGRTLSGVEALRLRLARYFDEPDTNEPNPNAKYGFFYGRRIIGHDTEINGGVYIGGGAREAIVVDDYRHSESADPNRREQEKANQVIYDKVYTEVLDKIASKTSPKATPSNEDILQSVYDTVYKAIEYDDKGDYVEDIARDNKDKKVNLTYFIKVEPFDKVKGVCRHQALLAGYLLERLVDEGRLHGKASVQRNRIKGYGAHAWANFTTENGVEYIVDVTQGFVGRAEDAPYDGWIYIGH